MNHYLSNEMDRERAAKRGGKIEFLRLDEELPEERFAREALVEESPERAFERRWAVTLLQQSMNRLEQEFAMAGKGAQFECIKVFLTDRPDDRLWNVTIQREVGTLVGHLGPVSEVAFSKDGNLLLSCGEDMTARLWRAATFDEASRETTTRSEFLNSPR